MVCFPGFSNAFGGPRDYYAESQAASEAQYRELVLPVTEAGISPLWEPNTKLDIGSLADELRSSCGSAAVPPRDPSVFSLCQQQPRICSRAAASAVQALLQPQAVTGGPSAHWTSLFQPTTYSPLQSQQPQPATSLPGLPHPSFTFLELLSVSPHAADQAVLQTFGGGLGLEEPCLSSRDTDATSVSARYRYTVLPFTQHVVAEVAENTPAVP